MKYEKKWLDEAQEQLHLSLNGKLQFGKFKDLQSYIFNLQQDPPQHITFDLSEVDQIDSSGLGLLMVAHELTGKSGNVTLKYPQEQPLEIFNVCKIDQMMEVVN